MFKQTALFAAITTGVVVLMGAATAMVVKQLSAATRERVQTFKDQVVVRYATLVDETINKDRCDRNITALELFNTINSEINEQFDGASAIELIEYNYATFSINFK